MTRTHPPLDPELTAVLTVVHEHLSPSIAAEDIEELRANPMFAVADEDLTRNGTVALLARDRGGPRLLGQVLMCPMLDDRFVTPSSRELDGEGIWDATSNTTGWDALLGERRGGSDVSIYAAPARATDLTGLPTSFVDVGSVETFRDEDIDYAARLLQAGVQCELHVWPGGFHGFDGMAPQASLSQTASATRAAWVRRLLAAG
jgi:acetyl esterase/lipase